MTTRSLMLAAAVATLSACGPSWTIVKQTSPNPFVGKQAYTVDAAHFDGLMVGGKPEAQYLSDKKPEAQQSFAVDKASLNQKFGERLMANKGALQIAAGAQAAEGSFLIRPLVTDIEPGSFNGFVNLPTTVKMHLQLADTQGATLDEVELHATVAADLYHPSVTQRLQQAAEQLADQTVRYVSERVTPKN